MSTQVTLKTVLTTTFDLPSGANDDAEIETLKYNLNRLAGLGRVEGMFTADTDAELNDLTLHVESQPCAGATDASSMTSSERDALAQLRHRGFAVIVWTPDEMGEASAKDLTDRSIEFGHELIDSL